MTKRVLRICSAAIVGLFMCAILFFMNEEPRIRKTVKSEHYILTTIEDYGFAIKDRSTGEAVGGWVDLYGPLVIRDETGKEYLYTNHDASGAYYVVEPDDELKSDIIEMIGEREWYAVDAEDYDIVYDEDTGLHFLCEKDKDIWMSNVVLYDEDDIDMLERLASEYADIFPDYMKDIEVGYIYAIMEVKKLSMRFDGAWLFVGTNGLQYIDIERPDRGWTLELAGDEYYKLEEYVRANYHELKDNDIKLFDDWKDIFEKLGIEYDPQLDPDSVRYKAALDDLIKIWGSYPAPGMSEETAEKNLKNHMKEFDEDGYHIGFRSIAGMDATDVDEAVRHRIIDVPEQYREAMYQFEFTDLVENNGDGRDYDAKGELYREYQEDTPKGDRLAGTWTLGQYDRIYRQALMMIVLENDPDWETGDSVDEEYLSAVSREIIESCIVSDGKDLYLTWGDGIRDLLSEKRRSHMDPANIF